MAQTTLIAKEHEDFSKALLTLLKNYRFIHEQEHVTEITIQSNTIETKVYLNKIRGINE